MFKKYYKDVDGEKTRISKREFYAAKKYVENLEDLVITDEQGLPYIEYYIEKANGKVDKYFSYQDYKSFREDHVLLNHGVPIDEKVADLIVAELQKEGYKYCRYLKDGKSCLMVKREYFGPPPFTRWYKNRAIRVAKNLGTGEIRLLKDEGLIIKCELNLLDNFPREDIEQIEEYGEYTNETYYRVLNAIDFRTEPVARELADAFGFTNLYLSQKEYNEFVERLKVWREPVYIKGSDQPPYFMINGKCFEATSKNWYVFIKDAVFYGKPQFWMFEERV